MISDHRANTPPCEYAGFSTATQIRLARYLGEGKPEAAKRILKACALLSHPPRPVLAFTAAREVTDPS